MSKDLENGLKFVVTYMSCRQRDAVTQFTAKHFISRNSFVNLALIEKLGRGAVLDQLIKIATRVVTNAQLPESRSAKPSALQSDEHSQSKPKTMLRFSTIELREAVVAAADEDFVSINKFINIAINEKLVRAHALERLIELSACKLFPSDDLPERG